MVSTRTESTRARPTREEAIFMIDVSEKINRHNEPVGCPRCGQPLLFEQFNSSYSVSCTDESCIMTVSRGI